MQSLHFGRLEVFFFPLEGVNHILNQNVSLWVEGKRYSKDCVCFPGKNVEKIFFNFTWNKLLA